MDNNTVYRTVKLTKGARGWGGPIYVTPTEEKNTIISFTGGGIHPIARKIADLTGAKVVDAFNNPVAKEVIACAVVDCGGTVRLGYYPQQGIPTLNINAGEPSGPLAQYCVPELYISGATIDSVELAEGSIPVQKKVSQKEEASEQPKVEAAQEDSKNAFISKCINIISVFGRITGRIVNVIYSSAREAVNVMIRTMIPFIIFISLISGIILKTGVGNAFADMMSGILGTIPGLIVFAIILSFPILSPLLGPGAIMESVLGVLVGNMIAAGTLPISMAIPAWLAIGVVSGCDFVPVALSLADADPDTIRFAVPAVLLTRFITSPLCVLLGWLGSIGM